MSTQRSGEAAPGQESPNQASALEPKKLTSEAAAMGEGTAQQQQVVPFVEGMQGES